MISDNRAWHGHGRRQADAVQQFAQIAGERGYTGRPVRVARILFQQVTVVANHGAAPRGSDDDGIQGCAVEFAMPRIDVGAREGERLGLPPEVMRQGAAAALAPRPDHLRTGALEQPHRGLLNVGIEHGLDAAACKADAPLACGWLRSRGCRRSRARHPFCGPTQTQQAREGTQARNALEPTRERLHQRTQTQGDPKQHAMRHQCREQRAQGPIPKRSAVMLLDISPTFVDDPPVAHTRGTMRFAREAGQAAIEVLDHLRRGLRRGLEHSLDQIDAPARAVELIAEQDVGRAGRRTKPAVHALADGAGGGGRRGIGE